MSNKLKVITFLLLLVFCYGSGSKVSTKFTRNNDIWKTQVDDIIIYETKYLDFQNKYGKAIAAKGKYDNNIHYYYLNPSKNIMLEIKTSNNYRDSIERVSWIILELINSKNQDKIELATIASDELFECKNGVFIGMSYKDFINLFSVSQENIEVNSQYKFKRVQFSKETASGLIMDLVFVFNTETDKLERISIFGG